MHPHLSNTTPILHSTEKKTLTHISYGIYFISAYKYGPVFITYDLGPEGKTKVPLANLWQFLRNNGFHAHFDAYKLPAGLDWQDVKEESWARYKKVRCYRLQN